MGTTPTRQLRDEWIYLMQHVGIPTRLLDWSEGSLIGLYFGVHNAVPPANPGVWVMHRLMLNLKTIGQSIFPDSKHPAFVARCDDAFQESHRDPNDFLYPIAILPTNVHSRMRSRRGCFTLHGFCRDDFEGIASATLLADERLFIKYRIPVEATGQILRDLRISGISHSTLFPDHDGLAIDLKRDFKGDLSDEDPRPRFPRRLWPF
jgi:hypothetical protein